MSSEISTNVAAAAAAAAAPTSSETERRSVTFAAPQDIMGERISFSSNNNIDNDGGHKKSVQGIIEYGKAPSEIADSTHVKRMGRRK